MEGSRVQHFKNAGIQDAALTQRYPATESGLCKYFFRTDFGQGIHIVFSRGLRLIHISPMTRRITVSILRHRAYIYDSHIV